MLYMNSVKVSESVFNGRTVIILRAFFLLTIPVTISQTAACGQNIMWTCRTHPSAPERNFRVKHFLLAQVIVINN